jgi:hypothetical protein
VLEVDPLGQPLEAEPVHVKVERRLLPRRLDGVESRRAGSRPRCRARR